MGAWRGSSARRAVSTEPWSTAWPAAGAAGTVRRRLALLESIKPDRWGDANTLSSTSLRAAVASGIRLAHQVAGAGRWDTGRGGDLRRLAGQQLAEMPGAVGGAVSGGRPPTGCRDAWRWRSATFFDSRIPIIPSCQSLPRDGDAVDNAAALLSPHSTLIERLLLLAIPRSPCRKCQTATLSTLWEASLGTNKEF